MPRGYNLASMEYSRLLDLLEYEKKDPNEFLKGAIVAKRLDLLPLLFDFGANAQDLLGVGSEEYFLNTCDKDIASYLSYFFNNQLSSDNDLSIIVSELDHKYFGKRLFANRHAAFSKIEKTGMWSIGLTELESRNSHFLESMNIICEVGSWEDRFVNVNLEKADKILVTTIKHIGLNRVLPKNLVDYPDSEFLSPNISNILKIYLINGYDFKSWLSDLTWSGFEKPFGIALAEASCVFSDDGRIDFRILDLMKDEYCRK